MGRVFVVGALHLDVVVDAPRLPALDETLVGRSVDYRFGGKGGNQAVAAAQFGAEVAMAGRVGRDRFGEDLLAALDAAGVDRAQVRLSDGASGMSVAITDADGAYGAVIVSGVNREIEPDEVAVPVGTDMILLQSEVPEAVNLAVARAAGAGPRVILNAAPARAVDAALLRHLDLLVVNRVEAAQMVGAAPGAMTGEALLAGLRGLGVPSVILTLGEDGMAGAEADGPPFRHPGRSVETVSTHGAGDAFLGALAARLADGVPLQEAAGFANAAAALIVATAPERRREISAAAVARFQAARP